MQVFLWVFVWHSNKEVVIVHVNQSFHVNLFRNQYFCMSALS